MGGCEPRIEVIMKMQKHRRGSSGCEPRIEVHGAGYILLLVL